MYIFPSSSYETGNSDSGNFPHKIGEKKIMLNYQVFCYKISRPSNLTFRYELNGMEMEYVRLFLISRFPEGTTRGTR